MDTASSSPAGRTPAQAWAALLRHIGRGAGDRRLRVAGAGFRLRSFHGDAGGSAWSPRRLHDVRAELVDADWDGLLAREVTVACDEVVLGPRGRPLGLALAQPDSSVASVADDACHSGK